MACAAKAPRMDSASRADAIGLMIISYCCLLSLLWARTAAYRAGIGGMHQSSPKCEGAVNPRRSAQAREGSRLRARATARDVDERNLNHTPTGCRDRDGNDRGVLG